MNAQAAAALQKANNIRKRRSALKRDVKRGKTPVAKILLELPAEAATMPLDELLCAQRRWGPGRCRKLAAAEYVRENKPIGQLTERQRRRLAELVSGEVVR